MALRMINTLGLKNKQTLKKEFGFKSITQAKKDLGFQNDAETYAFMKDTYNQNIIEIRKNKKKTIINKVSINKDTISSKVEIITNMENVYLFCKNNKNQRLLIQIVDPNKNILKNVDTTIGNIFPDWWKTTGMFIFQNSTDNDDNLFNNNNATCYIWKQNTGITFAKVKQHFKEGNVNCLLEPIRLWVNTRIEETTSKSSKNKYKTCLNNINKLNQKYYNSGIDEDIIQQISNMLHVDISITKPLCDIKYIEVNSNTKALKSFKFLNTRCNHVELNEIVNESDYTTITRKEMQDMADKLDDNEKFYNFSRDNIGICKIITINGVYKLSNEFYDDCNDFEKRSGLWECKIDDVADKELSDFIKTGTHYNGTTDFVNINNLDGEKIQHIDMEKAYTQYNYSQFYQGFIGKITDFRKCDKIEGVGHYQITDLFIPEGKFKVLNDKMTIYINNNIYFSAELNMLTFYGCSYKITKGCWGRIPLTDINLQEPFLLQKYEKVTGYARFVGMCDMHHLEKKTYMKGNAVMLNLLQEHSTSNVTMTLNGDICISYLKKSNFHLGHFTASVLAYQRLNVIEQLINMNYSNLIRICVDGIYYHGTGKETLFNAFRYQAKFKLGNSACPTYISNLTTDIIEYNCGNARVNYGKELHIGEGGNGKTHLNLIDTGLIRPLYVAPSWKLATKKWKEYNIKSQVWANIYSRDPEKISLIKKSCNCLIIDEVSMMSETQKQFILKTYPNMKLIFCGDLGYQAPTFEIGAVEMNSNGFDTIIEHTTNYRFKCDKLKKIIQELRKMIDINTHSGIVNQYVKDALKHQTITREELKDIYEIDDLILCRNHNTKDIYTAMFSERNKWYVTENTRDYKNGEIVIGEKPNVQCKLQHSYTIHSIQGETAKNTLFIDMTSFYSNRIIYTAISRAINLNSIYLIV